MKFFYTNKDRWLKYFQYSDQYKNLATTDDIDFCKYEGYIVLHMCSLSCLLKWSLIAMIVQLIGKFDM